MSKAPTERYRDPPDLMHGHLVFVFDACGWFMQIYYIYYIFV